jgi:hypothetical protein
VVVRRRPPKGNITFDKKLVRILSWEAQMTQVDFR